MTRRGAIRTSLYVGLGVAAACIVAGALLSRCTAAADMPVRPAAVAGTFYPATEGALRGTVAGYLREAAPQVPEELRQRRPTALIVPHAGYRFSGPTAAYSFKLLEGTKAPSRIVLIGPSHYSALVGTCSVAQFSQYETPLGKVAVDAEARRELLRSDVFRATQRPHIPEHCLEVEIPFLQVLWPETPKIVPILVGRLDETECRAAAAGISRILDQDSLVIISTDFAHYGGRYTPFAGTPTDKLLDKIKALDMGAVKHVEALDPAGFRGYQARTGATICGWVSVNVVLEIFSQSESSRAVFLRWANSAESTRDYTYCVSYVAAAVYAPPEALQEIKDALAQQKGPAASAEAAGSTNPLELTDEEKGILLRLAREAVRKAVSERGAGGGQALKVDLDEMPERLRAYCGGFVTLKRNGLLRGCIGRTGADQPLCQCVAEVAVLAALKDRRFVPVREEELDDIALEISVLGPLTRARGFQDIRVGRDGLIVSKGNTRGLLLPQVATEQGWTAREFLEQTCRKAGLPRDAWQQEGAIIQRFSATVFGEADLKAE